MPSLNDLLGLCKLKVVALILLTAVVGMFLAVPAPYFPDLILVVLASLGIGLASASAAVFNHIVDEQIDIEMSRTNQRPLPQGKVSRNQALVWGVFLGVIGLGILQLFVNTITMILTFISLIGYAVIYTMYLKRATPQNIVIGGAAGAAPPILGWTSIAGTQNIEYALLLFLIVFVWTPPHFWALAIFRVEEYRKVDVPMLPVTHGLAYTRVQILFYTILLILVTLLPYLSGMSGLIYLASALILGFIFLAYAIRIYKNPGDNRIAWRTFMFSVNYLMLLFVALLIDHYWLITLG
ncbi:Heme O synthase, protoheme IX farnesyltransferase (EC 2.5.1.-) COX10-CtaB [uncultured Gammaproteobacteria bacterium]|jgi:protoheme IX farnesyltransferase|uniref:Heme O synthase, protoheme IX farnesyltransferase, COX10-CtaB n=3 Tax=sulfur-oxidizing symbionts TaxID=32036 RepID=A0ACA8ZST0_9GAMM|nr:MULTISPECIES: heme o synthase [Gammaproteobacteria]CAC9492295.1 Heme O synthase, protoheme IX farnesyltransferase (EC 2.5.1.-) COX10-CtaB [uncultured Gammaproteobacteria bacterium]CAB5503140.1 Heme O synthase, protoheme IX farnesyltransferase, COX10-CtaB [Bathymodiolus thermophilus thioautotrophic gill symbiont]CAB5506813.1 Heme O synthase, protoheme IX farnesyltransferase, COX10-CtaB [Bathymodiolus azoricus thioautotrophic gill symbiont]CAC9498309.1 Heme O synthase, protoheme IX farnesyltra